MQSQSSHSERDGGISSLLARARAGDADAMEQLFRRCRANLIVMARAQSPEWLQSKVDASDIVQETLLAAYRDFGQFRGETSAEWLCWLRTVLAHQIAAVVRRYAGTLKRDAGRERPPERQSAGGSLYVRAGAVAKSPTPSQVLIQKEGEIAVADAIMQLSPDYQRVIVLRNLQCLPFDEIAKRMGRSRPAVQMLWVRAIRKLHEVLSHGDGSRAL